MPSVNGGVFASMRSSDFASGALRAASGSTLKEGLATTRAIVAAIQVTAQCLIGYFKVNTQSATALICSGVTLSLNGFIVGGFPSVTRFSNASTVVDFCHVRSFRFGDFLAMDFATPRTWIRTGPSRPLPRGRP